MISTFAKAGVAALIAISGLSATASTASAQDVRYGLYVQDGPRHGGHHGWGRPDRGRDRCAPWLAEEKASRMGLRRARVVDVSPRRVVVAGFDRQGRDRVVFANVRGCPVIRR
ncbi:hypothetical protein [Agrobacterium rubi]|uniref:Antifreeze protein n=2 Tax=Agrobacterium rubi TaxID=28099 RepID=A0AAE7R6M5_9HYPH|nr:hypothetical protein [Agrobacterium rubi]MBP1877024.1 hypothetical protein [Agrobacterium rubi]MCL6651209.1 hypothetical protein [Agrobacterium rubi]NTE86883.1 hypothetical protein [Agrobacterium rubi]NTF02817.1 hypothetical protein [Agrobacterium rubi]NTF37061.1 hypothetical protein [Agrobacterium rubi]